MPKEGIGMANEQQLTAELPHRLVMDGRNRLTVSGVREVESFDESMVALITVRGTLVVRGQGLHLKNLSLGQGEAAVDGMVESLTYEDEQPPKRGLWGRLFG